MIQQREYPLKHIRAKEHTKSQGEKQSSGMKGKETETKGHPRPTHDKQLTKPTLHFTVMMLQIQSDFTSRTWGYPICVGTAKTDVPKHVPK